VLLVDAGGYFPETDIDRDQSWFQMDAMKLIGTDAVGVGDRDLRFGIAYLRETARGKKLPLVCANLVDRTNRKPVVPGTLVKKVGTVTVGVFGLISDKVDLGPSRDSLAVVDPAAAAKSAIAELKKKGATVIVLLSQLGRVESEDLVTAVPGVDVLIAGRNVPILQQGRMIGNTVACFGGDQGQYIGRTRVTLGPRRTMASAENAAIALGPEVGDKADVAALVKTFEDSFSEKRQRLLKEQAAQQAAQRAEESVDRYLGHEVCARCHQAEAAQWATTAHARAWDTLVQDKKEQTDECVSCHVLGFREPGGFVNAQSTPALTNVQCESCHGMGTRHEAWAAKPARVTEQICASCHNAANDPDFNFAQALPRVLHGAATTSK
jgi:2',3'-cyclic-nucleotide 2'-phosphodiesterase (5'-nucleotidase family)